jgi:hypothetical protein
MQRYRKHVLRDTAASKLKRSKVWRVKKDIYHIACLICSHDLMTLMTEDGLNAVAWVQASNGLESHVASKLMNSVSCTKAHVVEKKRVR